MIDRHLVRDVGLAILLGLPTAALSRPQAGTPDLSRQSAPLVEQADFADQSTSERRFSIAK